MLVEAKSLTLIQNYIKLSMSNRKQIDEIVEKNNDNMRKLHDIVKQTMEEEALIVDHSRSRDTVSGPVVRSPSRFALPAPW